MANDDGTDAALAAAFEQLGYDQAFVHTINAGYTLDEVDGIMERAVQTGLLIPPPRPEPVHGNWPQPDPEPVTARFMVRQNAGLARKLWDVTRVVITVLNPRWQP